MNRRLDDFYDLLQSKRGQKKEADSQSHTLYDGMGPKDGTSGNKGFPSKRIKLRRPTTEVTRDSADLEIMEGEATPDDALAYFDHYMRTMVFEKATMLSHPNSTLEEKYWVVEWLLFYNKFMDHDQYKYLMKKITSTLIFYPRTKENQWVVEAKHSSGAIFTLIQYLKLYIHPQAIPQGQFQLDEDPSNFARLV